jgi:hypothetical protein
MLSADPRQALPALMRDWPHWTRGWWNMPVALLLCALAFPIVARVVVGPRGAAIHVRWAQPLDAPMRQQLEARFRLMDGQRMDSSTWRYDLADPSTENIRRIISDAAVEDTDGLDRARFSLGAAVRTGRRLRSGSGDAIVFAVDRSRPSSVCLARRAGHSAGREQAPPSPSGCGH